MRWSMGSLGMVIAAPVGAMALAWSGAGPIPLPTVPAPTELLAQSLYMRGTKIGGYTDDDAPFVRFANGVLGQTYGSAPGLTPDTDDDWRTGDQIEYNGGFWPFSQGGFGDLTYGASVAQGLGRVGDRIDAERLQDPDGTIVVVGYSQSAVILSQYKAQTAEGNIVYVLVSNPARPNGGILSRFRGFTIPILDIPLSGPAPTTSPGWAEGDPPTTYDLTQQYDGWADFPRYPLNVLATANAIAGIVYLHGDYENAVDPEDDLAPGAPDTDYDTYGDTAYYTVGTDLLPLLRPFEQVGVPRAVLLGFDAPLRVLVEQGYDRTVNPGESTPAGFIRIANPITDVANFIGAIPIGIDDGLEAAGYGRPLGTTPAGMYGVGGPEPTPPGDDVAGLTPVAPDNPPQQTPAKPGEPPVKPLARADDDVTRVDSEDAADAADTAVEKPVRPRPARPKIRGPISFARSIAKTIRTGKPDTEKPAAQTPDDKPAATSTDTAGDSGDAGGGAKKQAADKPDRSSDHPGRHRKAG
ncbi:PE-PPE domain-containing protein [Mycobacterium sp. NPDC003449]